jgi:ribokinase
MLDIITLGSNTLDLFAHTEKSQLVKIRTEGSSFEYLTYPVGSKILVTQLMHNFGGNGCNAAVGFSRLGLKTGYVGKVGNDTTGLQILKSLKKNKVTFLGARGSESGTSIILDAMGEDRTILAFKGCNNELKSPELRFSRLKARWFYLSSMIGDSLKTMQQVAEHAKKNKAKIAFNPSQTLIEQQRQATIELIKLSEILVLNKEEAQMILLQSQGTIEENLKKLAELGPRVVSITDGKNGAYAITGGYIYTIKARDDLKIVETTGAGDAFASTLTAGIILKKQFETCMKMAINQSENVIQGHGAQNHLADKKKLLSTVKKDKRKVEKKKTG